MVEEFAALADGQFIVGKVDATKYSDVARQYNIQSYPTLLFFHERQQFPYYGPRTATDMIAFATRLQSEMVILFTLFS